MPNEEVLDPEKPAEGADKGEISEAAQQILDEVRKQTEENKAPVSPPSSQPKVDQAAWVAQREDFKKKMGFNEEQMSLYERDKMSSQAPVLLELSKMKVRDAHKDYAQLEKAFDAEIANYVSRGQVINPELADMVFLMVKGREVDAGRYSPPSSQPVKKEPPTASSGSRTSRIASPGYSGSERGLSSGGSSPGSSEENSENQLTEREKEYARVINVDPKDYKKMKDEKERGIREIGEHSIRAPEIDLRTAGAADRDLAGLWARNGGKL